MGNVISLSSGDVPAPDSKLLDRVLQGLDASQRARVLDLVVRLGIEPDDPLFLISLATSQLQVLVEDAPKDWAELFGTFLTELEKWKENDLQLLHQMTLEAQAIQGLTETSKTLQHNIKDLQTILLQLIDSLEISNQNNQHWRTNFESLKRDLVTTISSTLHISKPWNGQIKPQSKTKPTILTWNDSHTLISILVGGCILTSFIGLLNIRNFQRTYTKQQQQLQELIQQQTQYNCHQGILAADNPLCKKTGS